MLKSASILLLAMLAPTTDPQELARKALNNCLVVEHNKAISAQTPAADFKTLVPTLCADEKTKYHNIIANGERNFGSSAKEADDYADEEVKDVINSVTGSYEENLSKNVHMIPEE